MTSLPPYFAVAAPNPSLFSQHHPATYFSRTPPTACTTSAQPHSPSHVSACTHSTIDMYPHMLQPRLVLECLHSFVFSDGCKKGWPLPSRTCIDTTRDRHQHQITCVYSTPPSHTINRAGLAGIDTGLHLGFVSLLTDSPCSLQLTHVQMRYPTPFRYMAMDQVTFVDVDGGDI
jgi:hypothetical protein